MNQAIMGAVASSVAGGFEGTIIEQDDFTGTTINTGKWSKNDSTNSITQNNELIVQPNTGTTGSRTTLGSNLVSVKSVTSGIATVSANLDFNLANHNFIDLKIGQGINSMAGITNGYNTSTLYLEVYSGGSLRYNFNSGIVALNQNLKVKITYDITTKDIKFWYWNSGWTQMGTTQNRDIGTTMRAEILCYYASGNLSWVGKIDNLYLTEGNFETIVP